MASFTITYLFQFLDNSEELFELSIDTETLRLIPEQNDSLPEWTRLEYCQCRHCPLSIAEHPHCPLAVSLVNVLKRFGGVFSHDEVHVSVTTEERLISKETTVQRAVSSLMGLIIATCGCPHAKFLRPMARFHLPLSSEEETICRATSMYLLAQYFLNKENKQTDLELEGLMKLYQNIQQVNITVAERLRRASETDSSINALIILDIYAKAMPQVINKSLEEIRYIVTPLIQALDYN